MKELEKITDKLREFQTKAKPWVSKADKGLKKAAVLITASSLGLVIRRSKVVTHSAPMASFRDTYRPGCNLM